MASVVSASHGYRVIADRYFDDGQPRVLRVAIAKRTANQVVLASGLYRSAYCKRVWTAADFDRAFGRTPQEAVQMWYTDLRHEVEQLQKALAGKQALLAAGVLPVVDDAEPR